ncbi:MAG: 2-oxoglutarate dehydrogenase E1 component [Waddliaceae bacterium]
MRQPDLSNAHLVQWLYERYQSDPTSIDPSWKTYFEEIESYPDAPLVVEDKEPLNDVQRIDRLIFAYRSYGHLMAKNNPIETGPEKEPWQLSLTEIGFKEEELSLNFPTNGLMSRTDAPLREIVDVLKEIYSNKIGIEYMGVQNPDLEKWLQKQIEPTRCQIQLSIEQKKMILNYLNQSELFEVFIHTKYVGQKRFSLEGGETLIPILGAIIERGADLGLEDFILGMAHRGRLNVLSNILQKSYGDIFSEFEEGYVPISFEGSGDVKYHKGFVSKRKTLTGKEVELTLAPNPSHLEAVYPVVEGQARAKQIQKNDDLLFDKVIPILVHGDAALSGQGVVYETMQMYNLEDYRTGGTVHLVINNQIGFTTLPNEARSTHYCTDIARTFSAPVFHVNAEDPESCIFATFLAIELRQRYQCDVFIDILCYRKYGHNETDEPAFTQPLEYQLIRKKKSIREIYRDDLIQQGVLERKMAEALEEEFKAKLQVALSGAKEPVKKVVKKKKEKADDLFKKIETGVQKETLKKLGKEICRIPEGLSIHSKLERLLKGRAEMLVDKPIDWGMGESLAYATLLSEGVPIRLAGQDSGRGTFSHRHAVWMDQVEEKKYCPFKHLKNAARFDVINSPLTEYAGLGFEYGYSLAYPDSLVIWEAQFGDFCNGAQIMIDQFIATAEQKWGQKSGLVMLLPHGYEGQGPEHSSGRMERFLTLSAENNLFVVNPTTPAQMFHLLRRQGKNVYKKPLIIFSPKALLRHLECVNPLVDFTKGTFEEIIDDPSPGKDPKEVVFCSGKIYYEIKAMGFDHLALIRIEQLYPLKEETIKKLLTKYKSAKKYIWAQEEPENMGAWGFIGPLLQKLLPKGKEIQYVGRMRSASPAAGSLALHKKQLAQIMEKLQ